MLAICSGDQTAYQAVVKRHLKSISHYAYRMLGNQKDTEDIAQETFLRLWLNAKSWQSEQAKLSTWIHRIAHNLCIDYLRKHSRVETQQEIEETQGNANESFSTDDNDQKMKLLRQALDSLPENQRSAITLCHYQNFSNKEAAAIMGISVKALESTVSRAKQALRQSVNTNTEQVLHTEK